MRRLAAGLVAVLAAVGTAGHAQDAGQAESLEPGLALLAATMAYTNEPFAERLRVYVGAGPWEGRSESAVVRCDPERQRVRLELGMLEVYFADGNMVAVRRDNARDVLVRQYRPPLTMAKLAQLLPPVPSPGLALALDEDLDALAPYLPIETWRSAEMDRLTGVTTLQGELAGAGPVTAHLERSGRVSDVVAHVGEDRWISIQATAAQPGDPGAWAIDPAGRRRVQSLADLAPARELRPGDAAPELRFVDGEGRMWRLSEAVAEGPVAIVLMRAGRRSAIDAGRAAIAALRARPELPAIVGVVYAMDAWSLEAVRRDRAALLGAADEGAAGAAPAPPGGETAPIQALWSVSPQQSRTIAPGEPAVIVVVGPDGVVRGVVAVAGREAGEIAADVKAAAADL